MNPLQDERGGAPGREGLLLHGVPASGRHGGGFGCLRFPVHALRGVSPRMTLRLMIFVLDCGPHLDVKCSALAETSLSAPAAADNRNPSAACTEAGANALGCTQ